MIINWNEELFILLSDATKEKIVEQSFYFKFDDLSILRKRKEIFFSLSSFRTCLLSKEAFINLEIEVLFYTRRSLIELLF